MSKKEHSAAKLPVTHPVWEGLTDLEASQVTGSSGLTYCCLTEFNSVRPQNCDPMR